MAEVVAALTLGSSIITFIDIGGSIISRVREYIDTSQEVPEVLRDVSDRLETLLLTTKNLESALNAGKLDDGARSALKNTVAGLERQARILQGLCEHMLPPPGGMLQKARKAISSIWKEKELKNVLQKIITYESTLNLYFTIAMGLKDSSSVHWTKRTFHDVPPFALSRFIGRRRILDQVAASFRTDNLEHRMITVLLGIGGQGKTMIAREYCRRLRGHTSLFWVDASSYQKALSGMQRVSRLLESSTTSDPSSRMQMPPATKLEELLHPFVIVLDNMDHAKDFTQIMQLIPENKLCMVLITSRHRDTQHLGICIEIKAMEQDEAVELLLTKCNISSNSEHQNHAESIVQTLACLPLAIDQAGAYVRSRNLPLARFIDHFETRKEAIMKYIPSGWPYQRAQDDQQCVSDLCVFTTWELSLNELRSSVDVEPLINLLTLAAFTGSSPLLPEMLRTQVEENLAAELGCRDLYTTDSKWDPSKYQDAVVQLYSVSLISEIDMDSAEIKFLIHPLVEEWLKVRAVDPKDKMYVEANTTLIHRICDRHIDHVTDFDWMERRFLCEGIMHCADQNGFFDDLTTNAGATGPISTDTKWIAKFSEVFVSALPSFVECCVECRQLEVAIAFMDTIDSYMTAGFVRVGSLPQFLCRSLCAQASIALHGWGWLETLRFSNNVQSLPDLKRVLEGDKLKMLRPGERCMPRLKLLYGQVCITLGKIEAARQLLTDGFATSQHTFGIDDVLTTEFQTTLAEVYLERREGQAAFTHLASALESGRSTITARTLVAKVFYLNGWLDKAETVLEQCLREAIPIVGIDYIMIWRIWYYRAEVLLRGEAYTAAEGFLRTMRDQMIKAKGPEHLEVLQITLQLALTKLRISEFEEAGQICQELLVLQQKRGTDTHDLIRFTKAVLWICHLQSGRTDLESSLKHDILESLENGAIPNPQLAPNWCSVARLAGHCGAVDVASVLRKHSIKAMELAFGVEFLQAMLKKEVSPEDSNNE
ncbi:hypothetical protein JMJ35_002733 [Cladonia borealis]|uniref:NB-ARC domain-containing protein n=1 Tax=Cladonia borealis TaxID=184061 RepID=A0AA39V702_9LECA|nr:hypothetical protein JMJ35_002733 [Cladonia borealis]